MSRAETLYGAIDSIDDKYLIEAFEYKRKRPVIKIMAAVAACLCICIAIQSLYNTGYAAPVTVYAYGSGQEIGWKEPTLMEGTISDNGEMHGTPLQFYISGKSIEKIRFSVKNQYISFMDWTQKREDYGTSKSFTIDYGDEADYYYLVIDWEPVNTIRTLTDHSDIGITDLPEEDREDIIVMQITYENGKEETCAIKINLTDDGKFETETVPYEISDEDTFVLNPDTVNVPVYNNEEDQKNGSEDENEEDDSKGGEVWSDITGEQLKTITETARKYYDYALPYKVTDITPDYDETAQEQSEYDGYDPDEILVLKVTVKDDEMPRYITIGSKDGWKTCTVLNEGY